jgi:uncharacterized membrane protein
VSVVFNDLRQSFSLRTPASGVFHSDSGKPKSFSGNPLMSNTKKTTLSVAAALAGAVAMVSFAPVASADETKQARCYGVAKAGENGCASAAANHSCAGESTLNYSGQDWKLVPAGTCTTMGGKEQAFEGTGTIAH